MLKRKQLEAEGKRIWGTAWKSRLSEYLECDLRTVMRWANGEVPIKKWLLELLSYKKPEKTREGGG